MSDHRAAEKFLHVSVDRCARRTPAGFCAGVSYEPEWYARNGV